MGKARKDKAAGTNIQKGLADASWGGGGVGAALSVAGMRAIDKSLSPQDAYRLSVDVQTAVAARAGNLGRCKLRVFFRASGDEVLGGDLYNLLRCPAPGYSQSAWVTEMASWRQLAGEMAASLASVGTRVVGMLPLSPFRLRISDPIPANSLADVRQWEYRWHNGAVSRYTPAGVLFTKNFNPADPVRGVPPVLAGVNEVTASHEAIAYNRRFFTNNATPNHILILPKGVTKTDADAFKSEYFAMHSAHAGNAHKGLVVEGGSGIDVKMLEQPVKDLLFQGVVEMTTDRVMGLYAIPPVESGRWDKAAYDSVDTQREVFVDGPLSRDAEELTTLLQTQLVDRHFALSEVSRDHRGRSPKLSKRMTKAFERAMDENPESAYVVVVDLDTLPIVAKLRQAKLDYALKLQQVGKYTPDQALEYVGMDAAGNEASAKVWVATTETPVDPDEPTPEPQPETPPAAQPEPPAADQPPAEPEADDEAAKARADAYRDFYRSLRKLTLEKLDGGRLWSLAEADALAVEATGTADAALAAEIRRDYYHLSASFRADPSADRKAIAKAHYNSKTRAYLRTLASV